MLSTISRFPWTPFGGRALEESWGSLQSQHGGHGLAGDQPKPQLCLPRQAQLHAAFPLQASASESLELKNPETATAILPYFPGNDFQKPVIQSQLTKQCKAD